MDFIMSLDYWAILKIIGIDIMLGGDNAIVIALACAGLAPEVRNKAIAFGTAGAVLARIVLLAIAGLLLGIPFVKLIAGLYLFYVGVSMVIANGEEDSDVAQKTTFWGAVSTVVLADIGMSTDNVLAVSAAAQSAGEHAVFYTIAGILFSIPIIVYGSKLILALMDKYKAIVWLGGMLLGWVATEMIITEPFVKENLTFIGGYETIIKVIGFLSIAVIAKLALSKSSEPQLA